MFAFVAFAYAQQESASASGRVRTAPTNYTPAYTAGSGYAAGGESTIALPEMAYDHPSYAPPPGSPPPFDKGLPGYGGGDMGKKDTDSMMTAVAEDPFSDDIDEYPRLK
jgi:hypothetical protein